MPSPPGCADNSGKASTHTGATLRRAFLKMSFGTPRSMLPVRTSAETLFKARRAHYSI